MTRWRKLAKGIAAAIAVTMAAGGYNTVLLQAADTVGVKDVSEVRVSVPDNKAPTYEYNKAKDFVLNIENTSSEAITDFEIGPDLKGEENAKWPFKTDYQKYSAKIEELKAGETVQVKFRFTQRDDVPTSRYMIHFSYTALKSAKDEISGSESFYINTTKKPEEKKTDSKKEETKTDKKEETNKKQNAAESSMDDVEAGGYSNGGASYSDGGSGASEGDGSVPRVIVTGFDTEPKNVKAGSDFTLTIHLKNTSKKSRVRNMLFDLNSPEEGSDEQTTAPAFLPSSGSSSIYLEGMKANGTADISIKLNAKSDLLQKPYSVELSMKYEDAGYNGVEASSSLSIPVKQDARFEFSEFELNPESIAVDDEANVMCNLYNMGRIKLYNVKAVFEGDSIEREEIFVGNVESGATASIDAMLKGTKMSEGPSPVTMTMSYENEEGEVSTEEKELMLEVTDAETEDMAAVMPVEEEESKGFPIIQVSIAVLVIAAAAASAVLLKKRKKRRSIDEEEELLYELDGTSEDERQ